MRTLRLHLLVAVALVAAASLFTGVTGALAAPQNAPDLVTVIQAPSSAAVYQSARWNVKVSNLSKKSATGVTLTINLPRTANSPTQYLMGTLGALNSRCTRSSTFVITCSMGNVSKGVPITVWFDIALPYSTSPIVFTAAAPVTNDLNPGDNSTSATAALSTYAVGVTAPRSIVNTLCTGTPALSSFIECVPGSTQSFTADLLPGTTATSGTVLTSQLSGGTWTLNGTQLTIDYLDELGTAVAAQFVGQGTSLTPGCWEGKTTFPSTTQYVSMYQVCLQ